MEHAHSYKKLGYMAIASYVAMYILMYAMVNTFANIFGNFNQAYMAALMTAAMILIELFFMGDLYQDKKKNIAIMLISIIIGTGSFIAIQTQLGVSDKQFLRSMIPHHASALLMCTHAQLEDQEVRELCDWIVASQQSQIDWMKERLQILNK